MSYMLLTSRDGVLVAITGTVPICTKLGLGRQLFVQNSTLMNFMKIRRTFYPLTITSQTDGHRLHTRLSFFFSFFFLFSFFLLRTERLTVLYLRLRVMCSHVPSYQCGGRVPVTPHAEVTPHCIQPFVAMHVRILPAACLFVAFFSFVTICILFHRLLSWVRIPYCFVGESSCEVCVASNPGPMFKRKNWAYGSVCLWTQYCRDLPYQGCWTGMNHWCRLKHKLAAVVKLLIFIDIWGSVL